MIVQVWYARISPIGRERKYRFIYNYEKGKPHFMSEQRIREIEDWFYQRTGRTLDISYKKLK